MARHGNDPKRRIAQADWLDRTAREDLAQHLVYVGSAHHKTRPGDYGFQPPVAPRPWKSVCDRERIVLLAEAQNLFREGILNGMFSKFEEGAMPKYIWSVDGDGRPYEAKIGTGGYHGYVLEKADDMCTLVLREWSSRCLHG